ncbi:MAG: hypothetical protein NTX64_02660 [Elusimicrobia bacterium]|nr:hypothetical protein [Elusimicrobiota bacterium]
MNSPAGAGGAGERTARREPFFTASNLLTLSRVPMGALIWLRPFDPVYLLSLMALAAATDVLDGWVERRLLERAGRDPDSASTTGLWLDPLCDKIFALSVIAAVMVTRRPPLFLLLLIVAREVIQASVSAAWRLVPAVRARLRPRFRASVLGKAATVAQFCTIAAILTGHPWQVPLALATGGLGISAGTLYVLRAWRAARKRRSP